MVRKAGSQKALRRSSGSIRLSEVVTIDPAMRSWTRQGNAASRLKAFLRLAN